jgi:hypothetical protein
MTHYPLLTNGIYANSTSLTGTYKVHAYLSGHEHQTQAFVDHGTH